MSATPHAELGEVRAVSAPQFTPGPWKVRRSGLNPSIISNGTAICNFGSARTYRTETEANANLIAAAPDLYAALEAVIHGIEVTKLPAELAHAKFALAKAQGRSA